MKRLIVTASLLCLFAAPAAAEVKAADAGGMQIRHEIDVAATPAAVYAAFVRIGQWWNPEHTYSGSSRHMTLDARAGGCFCETWGEGNAVEHAHVVFVMPGKAVRMIGGLGPLQQHGIAGALTFSFKPEGTGTRLAAQYNIGGQIAGGFTPLAGPVDFVLGEQVARLKQFAETGLPVAAPAPAGAATSDSQAK